MLLTAISSEIYWKAYWTKFDFFSNKILNIVQQKKCYWKKKNSGGSNGRWILVPMLHETILFPNASKIIFEKEFTVVGKERKGNPLKNSIP
jgi:hypothetical protein